MICFAQSVILLKKRRNNVTSVIFLSYLFVWICIPSNLSIFFFLLLICFNIKLLAFGETVSNLVCVDRLHLTRHLLQGRLVLI